MNLKEDGVLGGRRGTGVALLAMLLMLAASSPAPAEDTVHACIAASTDGQTLRQQGKLVAAREQMIACARDACPPIVRSHCARWLAEIEAATPAVVVRALDAAGADAIGARVFIDGRLGKLDGQPIALDPGPHTVAIEGDDGARKEEQVLLVEGETARRVTLRLPPAPPARASSARHVPAGAWILGGIGVVALGGATYFGLTAKSDLDTLQATCSPHCSEAQTQPGRTNALAFDVLLGAGAATVAAALVWGLWFDLQPVPGGAITSFGLAY